MNSRYNIFIWKPITYYIHKLGDIRLNEYVFGYTVNPSMDSVKMHFINEYESGFGESCLNLVSLAT